MTRVGALVLGSTWALCVLVLLTIVPSRPFVLLEPGSWGTLACVALFVVGSVGLPQSRLRPLVILHLGAVALAIIARPLTWAFGRDGSIVIMSVHIVLVLTLCTRGRSEAKLAVGASLAALLMADAGLSAFRPHSPGRPQGVLDYGDVMGPMIAGAGQPVAARELVEGSLLSMEPDAVLVGITLGNDISQSWLEARRLPATTLEGPLLPPEAFAGSELFLLPVRLDRTLLSFRVYARLTSRLWTDVIQPWFDDYPRHVHVFDPGHSLGHFYARHPLPLVEQSFDALFDAMDGLARSCAAHAVPLEFVLLPQRFQVDSAEWRATLFRFGLDPAAFDVERPNRRIVERCSTASIRCLDLLPALRSVCEDQACFQPLGDMHWSALAQAQAAAFVADHVVGMERLAAEKGSGSS